MEVLDKPWTLRLCVHWPAGLQVAPHTAHLHVRCSRIDTFLRKYLTFCLHKQKKGFTFALVLGGTQDTSGCSAVGSAPGLGPGGRPFESGHPDKKTGKSLQVQKKVVPLQRKKQNGALDEWLSLWSAKPATAVRIRQAPPKRTLYHL